MRGTGWKNRGQEGGGGKYKHSEGARRGEAKLHASKDGGGGAVAGLGR